MFKVIILFIFLSINFLYSNNFYYNQKISQFKLLESKDIVILGDSLVERGNWSDLLSYSVSNRGIAGDTTYGVYNRLHYIGSPKTVFIMVGINDLLYGAKAVNTYYNYKKIVSVLLSRKIKVYIFSILYIGNIFGNSKYKSINTDITTLNKLLKSYSEQVYDVNFIDLNEVFNSKNSLNSKYTNDGLHLLGNGYVIWANSIAFILKNRVK